MKSFFTAFSFSLLIVTSTFSQTLDIIKLDSLFDMLQSRGLANGSVAIAVHGKTVYQRTVGFAMLDGTKTVAPDINTAYRVGSDSKMFTAVMIFQLIDEGKLRLDATLAKYFPQLPNAKKITIAEMLHHRSGLHDYTHDTNFPDWMDKPKTHEEMLKIIEEKGADFEPGTKADYSNSNFLLLGYIVEKITGMTYAEALTNRITSKIGLNHTSYGRPIEIGRNESTSYKYADGRWNSVKETDLSIHGGAGSIVSTPTDLVTFIHGLFTGKLISRPSLDSMTTLIDGYGMGIFPYDVGSTTGYGHDGRIEEFYSAVRYYPAKELAVSYITNGILYPRIDILNGVLKICFSEDYTIPFSQPQILRSDELKRFVGVYSSPDLPMKVECKEGEGVLVLGYGGKSMKAEPINTNYFMNLRTGSFFEFNPKKGELQIKETANVYYLKKEQ